MYEDEDLQEIHEDIIELNEDISTLRRDLDNISASVEGSGENVTLNGTAEARFKKLDVGGNTEQEQLSGKNLFNKNITPYDNAGGNVTILNTGVRLTSTRSSSSTYGFQLYKILDLSSYIGSTIRIKMNFTASNSIIKPIYRIGFCDEDGQNRNSMASSDVSGTTISFNVSSISGSSKYLAVWLYITEQTALAVGDYIDYTDIIVTIDNADMIYEPYCGGIPSPNPGYSQEIINVTGDVNVKIQSKNLLNSLTKTQGYPSNTTSAPSTARLFTENTYVLGIATNNYYAPSSVSIDRRDEDEWEFKTVYSGYGISFPINFARNGSYRLSYEKNGNVNSALLKYDKTGNFIEGIFNNIFEIDKNFNYLLVFYTSTTNETVGFSKVQIEQGTTPTPYVPHQEQNLPFSLRSKNLFNYNNSIKAGNADLSNYGVNYNIENQVLNLSGTMSATNTFVLSDLNLAAGTYTISIDVLGGTVSGELYVNAVTANQSKQLTLLNSNANLTFTVTEPIEKITVYISKNRVFTNYQLRVQLEQGSTATDYEPYYDIKAMQGTTLEDNGIHQASGEYTFTGNENWIDYQGTQTGDFYKFYTTDVKLGRTNSMEASNTAYCTHFASNKFYGDQNGFGLTKNATYISIDKTIASTPAELKTWLATQYNNGNSVKIQYTLDTEEIISYKGVQQAQYNAIRKAISYDEQTNVSSNTIALFNVKTFRNMNTSIESLQSRIELLKGRS